MIKTLKEINTGSDEGRLLLSAIAKITTESQTNKTPDEVINQLNILADKMIFKDNNKSLFKIEIGGLPENIYKMLIDVLKTNGFVEK